MLAYISISEMAGKFVIVISHDVPSSDWFKIIKDNSYDVILTFSGIPAPA